MRTYAGGVEAGALAVLPLARTGKQPVHLPFFETRGTHDSHVVVAFAHAVALVAYGVCVAPIMDFAFDPFDERRIAIALDIGR